MAWQPCNGTASSSIVGPDEVRSAGTFGDLGNDYSGTMGRAFIACAVIVILSVGCSKPEAAFAGKWQLDPKGVKSTDAKADPNIGASLGFMLLDFKLDKTFVMSSREGDDSGTFGVEDGIVTM